MGLLKSLICPTLALAALALGGGCSSFKLAAPLGPDDGGWPMDGRTMERKRWTPTPVRPPLAQEWTYDISAGTGPWSPVVVDTVLFVSTLRGELFALNATSGKKLGKVSFGGPITGSPLPRRNIVVVPISGPGESLAAFDVVRSTVVWRGSYGDVEMTPLMIDRRVFFGTTSGSFACVDRETGDLIWSYSIPDNKSYKGTRASPASDGTLVVFGADDGRVYALDAENGLPRWTHATGAPLSAGVALSDSTVIAANTEGTVVGIDVRSGSQRWRASAGGPVRASPALAGGLAVIGASTGGMRAFRIDSGALVWTADTGAPIAAAPTAAGSYVYVGTLGRELIALGLQDGAILWRERVQGRIKSPAAAVNGMLYVTTDDRQLIAYRGRTP